MPLYLMRHADAVPERDDLADESRYLSERGRAEAHAVGEALRRQGLRPTAIVSSPLVRAVQTAELVAARCAPGLAVTIDEALAPGHSMRRLVAAIGVHEGALLVGHEPSLSALASALTERGHFPPFHKAQVLCIENGEPAWLLLPGDAAPRPFAS